MGETELTRNCILRISNKKILELIQECEKYPCMWDTTLVDYPNKAERLRCIQRIAAKLAIPHFSSRHVAIKFKNLRNSYCQELKKIAANDQYVPKVFWFPYIDKYLRDHIQPVQTLTPQIYKRLNEMPTKIIKLEDDSDDPTSEVGTEDVTMTQLPNLSPSSNSKVDTTCSEPIPSENHEEPKQIERSVSVDTTKRTLEPEKELEIAPTPKKIRISTRDDESPPENVKPKAKERKSIIKDGADVYDHFGAYVASLLKTLPAKKALILQPKLIEMIISFGMDDLEEDDDDDS
ncbi:uncharacterized protein LOC142979325 [Anticarsia gemmatalis]|uniref:uncharacterized protein LOC142979325 n=1 Tax=Anticarsia gemmatalis TaxID=129554 RepID=UPI003F76EBE9